MHDVPLSDGCCQPEHYFRLSYVHVGRRDGSSRIPKYSAESSTELRRAEKEFLDYRFSDLRGQAEPITAQTTVACADTKPHYRIRKVSDVITAVLAQSVAEFRFFQYYCATSHPLLLSDCTVVAVGDIANLWHQHPPSHTLIVVASHR